MTWRKSSNEIFLDSGNVRTWMRTDAWTVDHVQHQNHSRRDCRFGEDAGSLRAQQKQLLEQQKQMERQQQEIEKLRTQLGAQSGAQTLSARSAQLVDASLATASPSSSVAPILQSDADRVKESPLSFRIGGTDFTPGGFIDFENVFRTTNSGSVITTNFGAIPFSNTPQGHLTENRTTAQILTFQLESYGRVRTQ